MNLKRAYADQLAWSPLDAESSWGSGKYKPVLARQDLVLVSWSQQTTNHLATLQLARLTQQFCFSFILRPFLIITSQTWRWMNHGRWRCQRGPVAYPGILFVEGGLTNSAERTESRENGDGVPLTLQMSETRILIRLLRIYFPRNWEFGSALLKLRNFGTSLVWHALLSAGFS
jgi:hypothetical protein